MPADNSLPEFKKSIWERAYVDRDPEAMAAVKRLGNDTDADVARIRANNFSPVGRGLRIPGQEKGPEPK